MQNILGSKMSDSVATQLKAPTDNTKTLYGQNGYKGAASDTDLDNPTQSAMAADFPCDLAVAHDNDWQKRDVGKSNVADHPGMAQMRRKT